MRSLFAGLAAAASATIDAVFAETFLIEGRAAPVIAAPILANGRPDVNARPVASAERVSYPFEGVFVAPGAVIHARGRGMAESTTRSVVADTPMIDVDVASLQERPAKDDIIHRVDTGERFRVTDPFRAVDLGRALIALVPL